MVSLKTPLPLDFQPGVVRTGSLDENRLRRHIKQNVLNELACLIFALIYQIFGWPAIFEKIYSYPMIDRHVYEGMIVQFNLPTDYIQYNTLTKYFSFEWTWSSLISLLNRDLGLSPAQIFFLITTLVLWRFSVEVSTRIGWIYVPFLLNPLVVDFALSQLRLAFAIAIVSFVWREKRNNIVVLATYIICSSIHTAITLFWIMHLSAHLFRKSKIWHVSLLVLTGLLISAAIGPLRSEILTSFEDRRAAYGDMSSSFAYLAFWVVMLLLLLVRWKDTITTLDGRYAIVILSIVAFNLITRGYSTRFIVAAFPSLLIAMAQWRSKPYSLITLMFLPYSLLQWLYWLRLL